MNPEHNEAVLILTRGRDHWVIGFLRGDGKWCEIYPYTAGSSLNRAAELPAGVVLAWTNLPPIPTLEVV